MKFILAALLALALTGCAGFAYAGSAPSFSASRASVSASFSRPTYVAPPRVTVTPMVAPRVVAPVSPVVRPVATVVPVVRAPVVVAPVVRPVYVRPPAVHFWNNWYLYNYLYNRPVVIEQPTGGYVATPGFIHYRPYYYGGASFMLFVLILLVLWAIYYRD